MDAIGCARACTQAKDPIGAALWRLLCRVIEELLAAGAC
jgi:hypothetical protein